jgi:hypothetical protein
MVAPGGVLLSNGGYAPFRQAISETNERRPESTVDERDFASDQSAHQHLVGVAHGFKHAVHLT